MCPACISGGVLMVSGVVSTGGVAALASKLLRKIRKLKSASSEANNTKEK